MIGAPKGYNFSISDGLISQIRSVDGCLQYQLSCPISAGSSGSPVLNRRGEVIGVASWTKTDAQNVSFAIPAQEFIHLNLSNQPMSWEQLAAIDHPALTTRLMESRHAIDDAPEALAAGSFAAFQKKLKDSVGKSVTAVVEEEARTDIVNFIVE